MQDEPERPSGSAPPGPSFGNMGPDHWSRARADANPEALEYLRERSKAPGVAAGGAERNHYCMRCDGVIPYDPGTRACPHCGAAIEGSVTRYFNWVEMDEPPTSDASSVLLVVAVVGVAMLALGWILWKVAK